MGAWGWGPGTGCAGRVPDNPNNLLLLYFAKDKNAVDLMNKIAMNVCKEERVAQDYIRSNIFSRF